VPVVLYLDSFDAIPVDSLELLTQLAVLILKNQYLQQLTALESFQGVDVVAEGIEFPEPLQFSQDEEKPVAETIEEPVAVKPDEPIELIAEEATLQLAGTSSEEETQSSEGAEDDLPPETETLSLEETRVDPESTTPVPDHTAGEETEADPEPNRAESEFNLLEERESDPQATAPPPEQISQEEAADPEPVPEPPGFSYKRVPARGEETPTPIEDGESD
jgi:hypothetical protein